MRQEASKLVLGGALAAVFLAFICWVVMGRGPAERAMPGGAPGVSRGADSMDAGVEEEPGGSHRSAQVGEVEALGACTVTVLTTERQPLEDVLVIARVDGEATQVDARGVRTDETGSVILERLPDVGTTIIATKEGFATESVRAEPGATIEVILHPGWTASGVVEWGDGSRAEDVLVLALPKGRSLDRHEIDRLRNGIGGAFGMSARTRNNGLFAIPGLRRAESYSLAAVGPGSASPDPPTAREVGAAGHVVRLRAIYALQVEVTDEQGLRLKTSERVFGQGQSWSVKSPAVRSMPYLPAWLELTDASWLGAVPENSSHKTLLLFTTDEPLDEVTGIEFSVHVPGYLPVARSLSAPRLGPESKRMVLQVAETARAWGDVEIVIDSSTLHPLSPGESARNLGTLFLHGIDGTEASMRVLQTPSGRERLRGVPAGSYEARFEGRHTQFRYPPDDAPAISVRVKADGAPAVVRLDLRDAGNFVLELTDEYSRPFNRSVVFLLEGVHRSTGGGRDYAAFAGPPYVIDLLRPGDYVVRIESIAGSEARNQAELLLPSIAGETIVAELPVRVGG